MKRKEKMVMVKARAVKEDGKVEEMGTDLPCRLQNLYCKCKLRQMYHKRRGHMGTKKEARRI